jgi:hypothetical protein
MHSPLCATRYMATSPLGPYKLAGDVGSNHTQGHVFSPTSQWNYVTRAQGSKVQTSGFKTREWGGAKGLGSCVRVCVCVGGGGPVCHVWPVRVCLPP